MEIHVCYKLLGLEKEIKWRENENNQFQIDIFYKKRVVGHVLKSFTKTFTNYLLLAGCTLKDLINDKRDFVKV